MPPFLVAQLLAQFGTVGIPLIAKLMGDFTAGKTQTTVTVEDLAELDRLSKQKGEDIYAKLGITPPPPASAVPTAP